MKYINIIKEKNKEKLRQLLFKYIDITNFDSFLYFLKNNDNELYLFFKEIEANLIDLYINKEPLIFNISNDDIINVTGETGSGKSTYVKNNFNEIDYDIVETDKLFSDKFEHNDLLKEIRKEIFKKYSDEYYPGGYNLRINFNHFNECLTIILKHKKEKPLIIDSGQYRHLKNYDLLKGKLIIIRTSVTESVKRACERFLKTHVNPTEEEIELHKIKKYTAYELHKKFNTIIIKSFILYKF